MPFFIHRNPITRGLGATLVYDGNLVLNFWVGPYSGCTYFGRRRFQGEEFHKAEIAKRDEQIEKLKAQVKN